MHCESRSAILIRASNLDSITILQAIKTDSLLPALHYVDIPRMEDINTEMICVTAETS